MKKTVKNRPEGKGGESNLQELAVCTGDWRFSEPPRLAHSMHYGPRTPPHRTGE